MLVDSGSISGPSHISFGTMNSRVFVPERPPGVMASVDFFRVSCSSRLQVRSLLFAMATEEERLICFQRHEFCRTVCIGPVPENPQARNSRSFVGSHFHFSGMLFHDFQRIFSASQ